jgi:hypothetical protein
LSHQWDSPRSSATARGFVEDDAMWDEHGVDVSGDAFAVIGQGHRGGRRRRTGPGDAAA